MPDNASIYIADPSLLGSRLLKKFPEIKKYEGISEGDSATGMKITLPEAVITMNFMPLDEIEGYLKGFSGWVQSVLDDRDQLLYVLSRIHNVRFAIGCVIDPGFDEEDKIQEFLGNFNAHLNGLLFFANTLFDYDAEPLAGHYYDLQQEEK